MIYWSLILIMFSFASTFGYVYDSRREVLEVSKVEELCANHETLLDEIRDEAFDIETKIADLMTNLVEFVNHTLITELKFTFPTCYHHGIEILSEDVSGILRNQPLIPCLTVLVSLKPQLYSLSFEVSKNLDKLERYKLQCIEMPHLCGIEPTYFRGADQLNKLQLDFELFKSWRKLWSSIKECYEDMIFEVLETIYLLRLDEDSCEQIGSYNDFLFKLSLWPLTLDKLANPNNYWSKYSIMMTKNSYYFTKILSTEEKHDMTTRASWVVHFYDESIFSIEWMRGKLIQINTRLIMNMKSYIDNLNHEMNLIIQTTVEITRRLIEDVVEKWKNNDGRLCLYDEAAKINTQVENQYMEELRNECFQPIPMIFDKFKRILVNLTVASEHLKRTANCTVSEACERSASQTLRFDALFKIWGGFNLTNTWTFSKKCLNSASGIILGNIYKHGETRIKRCRSFPIFQGLYSQLPINTERYPSFKILESV